MRSGQKKGHIGIATARSFALAEPISSALHLTGPSIVHGGPRIADMASNATLWEKPMSVNEAKQIADLAYNLQVNFKLYDVRRLDIPHPISHKNHIIFGCIR